MTDQAFYLLLLGWGLAGASPGPATLAIAGTAMTQGRRAGLAASSGVICGSAFWGISAALGLSAVMVANAWLVEVLRYVGAAYLMYLAVKAARSALADKPLAVAKAGDTGHFRRGLLIHLTNPKAIFSWGAVFAVVVPPGADFATLAGMLGALIAVSCTVFWGYGLIFSSQRAVTAYARLRRWFEGAFAVMFGLAGFKILTTRLIP